LREQHERAPLKTSRSPAAGDQLKGRLSGLHSISINLSYRITLVMVVTKSEIVPIHVCSHDEVY